MKNTNYHNNGFAGERQQREFLTGRRDQEFMELFNPTLDAMLKAGVPHASSEAAQFTILNGHPHYNVSHERAYRCVCRMLSADDKRSNNARTYADSGDDAVDELSPLRQQMWKEITARVVQLLHRGMSVDNAVDHVLQHCRASRFFITPSTALTKVCNGNRLRLRACR